MKRWAFRLFLSLLLVSVAAGGCLGVSYLALMRALHPISPPILNVPGVRRLNRDVAAYRDPAWSPDGRYLAYARANVAGGRVQISTFEIYLLDIKTGDIRQLTRNHREDRTPSWSPDGTQIAFTSFEESFPWRGQVWIMNADGTAAQQVTQCLSSCSEPVWSPDGRKLILVHSPSKDEPTELYIFDLATGRLERLTDAAFDALHPAWSPDGTRIAYTEADLHGLNLWSSPYSVWSNIMVMEIKTQNSHQVTDGDADSNPSWSPNGQYLAFVSKHPTSRLKSIFVLNMKTGEVSRFLEGKFEEGKFEYGFADPAWSSDGRYIAFTYGWPSPTSDLYIAEVPEAFR